MLFQNSPQCFNSAKAEEPCVRTPVVNIFESDNEVLVEAEMPGVAKDSILVEIEQDELRLRGRTAETQTGKEYTTLYSERRPCEYRRVFLIGPDIAQDKINAKYENGTLCVRLEKSQKALPKKIKVE